MIRPIPGPWRIPPPFKPRYIHTETVTFAARCACGSGRAVTWTADRDSKPDCTCTCTPEANVTPPVTCWRCHRPLAADPTTSYEEIRIRGRNVTAHKPGTVECVPTLSHPDGATRSTPDRP